MKNNASKLACLFSVLSALLLTGCLAPATPASPTNPPPADPSPYPAALESPYPAPLATATSPMAPVDEATTEDPALAAQPTATPAPTTSPTTYPPVRFAVIGDYGAAGQAEQDVADLVKSWEPDFVITVGDNNYPSGEAATIDQNIGQYYHSYISPYPGGYGQSADMNRFFPTLGNHDWDTPNAQPYLDYFTLPGNERYYDFTWGPVHFFALDSDSREPDGVGSGSVQAAWLQERLARATEPWKIVYFHHPPYSSGLHGSVDWMRWPFREWGASAVLSGHDHTYERLLIDGLPYFINGVGGGAIYRFENILEASQVRYNEDYGAMLVDATPEGMTFQFINRSGVVIDSFSLTAESTAASPPQSSIPATPLDQSLALLPSYQGDLQALEDLTRYTIEADLDYPDQTFSGHAQVDYTNLESIPQDRLYFRLLPNSHKSYGAGSLNVVEVAVDGQPVETSLSLSDSVLAVRLPQPLDPSGRIRVDLDFAGEVPRNFRGQEDQSAYGIYNLTQGVLALSGWYPILAVYDEDGWNLDPVSSIGDSVYSEMAFYTVDVTAPNDVVLAATGVETDRQTVEEVSRYRFVSGPVRDFTLVASLDFQVRSQSVDGTQINSFFLRGSEAGGEAALRVASGSLETFNQLFGAYPYTELDVIQAPMRYAGGVEFPTLLFLDSDLYKDPQDSEFIITTAHEVAHQWWYNLVGNDIFDDPWLDEALATYSSALYLEQERSRGSYDAYIRYMKDDYARLTSRNRDDRVTEGLFHFEELDQPGLMYGSIVYTKGGLFFHELRETIGDAAFFAGLQSYFRSQIYQVAQVEDLLYAFEAATGHSLDDLYEAWLYSP